MEGLGSACLWGYTPSVDLLQVLVSERANEFIEEDLDTIDICRDSVAKEDLKILLVGAGDIRHVIKTISRLWRHGKRHLHFYLNENQAPILARAMLFLSLFKTDDVELSLQERAERILELYGNIQLRQKTWTFLQTRAKQLIDFVTNSDVTNASGLQEIVSLGHLKFREKDDLEFVFDFWRQCKTGQKQFPIERLWDERLRAYYKTRYDSRDNAADWDYHMGLGEKFSILYKPEFMRWRSKGLAFEVRDSAYDFENRTMATVDHLKDGGLRVLKWGYFADIVQSPHIPFGVTCEDKEALKKRNDQHIHSSQEISEFNIISMLYELENESLYRPQQTPRAVLSEIANGQVGTQESIWNYVHVHLLPMDPAQWMHRSTFQQSMDLIYISTAMAHRLPSLRPLMKESSRSRLVLETARLLIDLKRDQRATFAEKLFQMAEEAQWEAMNTLHQAQNDLDHIVFRPRVAGIVGGHVTAENRLMDKEMSSEQR